MARVDDYQLSFDLAAAELVKRDPADVAAKSGCVVREGGGALTLDYLGRPVEVGLGPITVTALDDGPEIPLTEQALVLHYLTRADGAPPTNQWITYREVESGEFYWSAFVKRAKAPLVGFFGARPKLLEELAAKVGMEGPGEGGDVSVIVRAFPRVPLMFQLWEGDEEFPADGNVLFDGNIDHYLITEDVALIAGLPIYKMMAMARN